MPLLLKNYPGKMNELLNDSVKFALTNDDWFKVVMNHEDQINQFLSSFFQNKAIDKAMNDHLRISSILYGLS